MRALLRRPAALAASLCLILLATLLATLLPAPALAGGEVARQRAWPRARAALDAHAADVERTFREAGAAWPPRGLLLVAYKLEGELELHAPAARGPRWVKVRTFPICAESGVLGPKNYEGDLQVPEGFYQIDALNPVSQFHLSLHVDYPNRADRARIGPGVRPGHSIMVHGNCVTIGCLPMEDGPISWIYAATVLAREAGVRALPLHLHPCRHDEPACVVAKRAAALARPELPAFWADLEVGHAAWRAEGRPPNMQATPTGGYRRQ